jgi:GTP-binding protein YchF
MFGDTDAILHVVRCFPENEVIHVAGKIDPLADIEVINLELILSDLQMAENCIMKLEKQARTKKEAAVLLETLKKASAHLNDNKALRTLVVTEEEKTHLAGYPFLTNKPVLYVANVSENDLPSMQNPYVETLCAYAKQEGHSVIALCAKLEEEIAQLEEKEACAFLEALGIAEPGLNRLIKEAFRTLGLITYLTAGELEARAWTITQGTKAPEAAGKIHTDLQKGFIRAEVVSFEDMRQFGRVGARQEGKARSEGKDYIVRDGDVILFFHN